MMRLHYHPRSPNARRAVMVAHHLKCDVELVNVDLMKGEQKTPAFMKMNPNARVPVLEDGDFILWESRAIIIYLAEKTPGQTVYPSDARARADIHRWMFWSAAHFMPSIAVLGFERVFKKLMGMGDPDPKEEERGERLFHAFAPVLDAQLAGREWLTGSSITLADFCVASPLVAADMARLPVKPYANLQAWFARMKALDAWKKVDALAGPPPA
jgi:glutathione S-transferase